MVIAFNIAGSQGKTLISFWDFIKTFKTAFYIFICSFVLFIWHRSQKANSSIFLLYSLIHLNIDKTWVVIWICIDLQIQEKHDQSVEVACNYFKKRDCLLTGNVQWKFKESIEVITGQGFFLEGGVDGRGGLKKNYSRNHFWGHLYLHCFQLYDLANVCLLHLVIPWIKYFTSFSP